MLTQLEREISIKAKVRIQDALKVCIFLVSCLACWLKSEMLQYQIITSIFVLYSGICSVLFQ